MNPAPPIPDAVKEMLDTLSYAERERRFGHLDHRTCTAEAPMPREQMLSFRWSHPDAEYVEPFFNLALYACPHCKVVFHAKPREH